MGRLPRWVSIEFIAKVRAAVATRPDAAGSSLVRVVPSVGVECLDCNGEEGMGEDCGVNVVPEEGVGRVGADGYIVEAGSDDVGEAEVSYVVDDCVEEIERVQVGDVDSWIEILEEK